MITFTPLSGAARSSRTVPLAYLLQVDDVRILLDCGSPDWCPEADDEEGGGRYGWEEYCRVLREWVVSFSIPLVACFCAGPHPTRRAVSGSHLHFSLIALRYRYISRSLTLDLYLCSLGTHPQ